MLFRSRAWTVQLVVDSLYTIPEIDKARIAITGYSRGGKMAATAAAFDERIAAVVAGSTGVGGVLPWRLSGERGMGEGIESTTRMFPLWFAPQLRFFSGREDRLPVDANLLGRGPGPALQGDGRLVGLEPIVARPVEAGEGFQLVQRVRLFKSLRVKLHGMQRCVTTRASACVLFQSLGMRRRVRA